MRNFALVFVLVMGITAGSATASWIIKDPAKYVQLPDLTTNGLAVEAGVEFRDRISYNLADDWVCTNTNLITEIHIWGAWRQDGHSAGEYGALGARIYSNEPNAINGGTPGKPGTTLWGDWFFPYDANKTQDAYFTEHQLSNATGGWNDPNVHGYTPNDHVEVWQYNLHIDPNIAFEQQGTSEVPVTYWLAIGLANGDANHPFGWMTSSVQRNHTSVFGSIGSTHGVRTMDGGPMPGTWYDNYYPSSHPYAIPGVPAPMDLAFVIVPEPGTLTLLALGGLVLVRRKRLLR